MAAVLPQRICGWRLGDSARGCAQQPGLAFRGRRIPGDRTRKKNMTSMVWLIERDANPGHCLSVSHLRSLGDVLHRVGATVPGLPGFRVTLRSHPDGRWFVVQRQGQTVFAGAVASTPTAARELWRKLHRSQKYRVAGSEPVGRQDPGNRLWAELSLQDFTGVSPDEVTVAAVFSTRLLRALIRERLESASAFPVGSRRSGFRARRI